MNIILILIFQVKTKKLSEIDSIFIILKIQKNKNLLK